MCGLIYAGIVYCTVNIASGQQYTALTMTQYNLPAYSMNFPKPSIQDFEYIQ